MGTAALVMMLLLAGEGSGPTVAGASVAAERPADRDEREYKRLDAELRKRFAGERRDQRWASAAELVLTRALRGPDGRKVDVRCASTLCVAEFGEGNGDVDGRIKATMVSEPRTYVCQAFLVRDAVTRRVVRAFMARTETQLFPRVERPATKR